MIRDYKHKVQADDAKAHAEAIDQKMAAMARGNQRNVDAIEAILKKLRMHGPLERGDIQARDEARALAAEGVLVPSAMTDAEVLSVVRPTGFIKPLADAMRYELECIARGEAGQIDT